MSFPERKIGVVTIAFDEEICFEGDVKGVTGFMELERETRSVAYPSVTSIVLEIRL